MNREKIISANRIKVLGYYGLWSVIEQYKNYVLLEHNTYGDETESLVINLDEFIEREWTFKDGHKETLPTVESGKVIETFDDIITALEDEGII